MKLALLDIDGTILLSRGSGRRSMAAALTRVLGRPVNADGVSFSGRTDRQILRDMLALASDGHSDDDESVLDQALHAYRELLPVYLDPDHVDLMPGVVALIETLHLDPGIHLGLLTGNVQQTAYLKLNAVGLGGYFAFGAFGSDEEDRNALPPIAIARAETHTGVRFAPADVVIIGDTVHDIACGKVSGCRTIAVCTGRYTRDELAPAGPDMLVDDLSDAQAITAFIRSE